MPENATRIAGLFAWWRGAKSIELIDVEGAEAIVEYSMKELLRYSDITLAVSPAETLWQWMIRYANRKKKQYFTASEISQAKPCGYHNYKELTPILQLLEDYGYIRIIDQKSYNNKIRKEVCLNPNFLNFNK